MNKDIYAHFARFLLPYGLTLTGVLLMVLLTSLLSLATPYILKIIIDDVFVGGDFARLINILLLLLVIYIVRIVFSLLTRILYTKVSRSIVSDIRVSIFDNAIRKDLGYYRTSNIGDIMFLMTSDVEAVEDAITTLVLDVLDNFFTVVGIVVMLLILDVELTWVVALIFPLIILTMRRFAPIVRETFRLVQEKEGSIYNFFHERLQNIRALKSYRTEDLETDNARELHGEYVRRHVANAVYRSLNNNISVFLMAVGPLIVLGYGGMHVFEGTLTVGALIAFVQYLNKSYSPVLGLVNSYNNFSSAQVSMQRLMDFLDSDRLEPTKPVVIDTTDERRLTEVKLEGIDLAFGANAVFTGAEVVFTKGLVYGLIGESGSGKSSMVNLLCGFLKPDAGRIVFTAADGASLSSGAISRGLVEKENQLFGGTVAANVVYGSQGPINPERLVMAIKLAGLATVLGRLEAGMETTVNQAGGTFSDGQKQRISLARALYRQPDLLIFDESLASLDLVTEAGIMQNLKRYFADTIILVITHRPKSLRHCDVVYEIRNQGIVPFAETVTASPAKPVNT